MIFLCGEVAQFFVWRGCVSFCEERLRDFFGERLCDFFLRLHDFFGGEVV